MQRTIASLLLMLLAAGTAAGQSLGLGLGLTNTPRFGGTAYTRYETGIGPNPTAPFATRGDIVPGASYVDEGKYHRLPRAAFNAQCKCANGDVLIFYKNSFNNSSDAGVSTLMLRRSRDRGKTWGSPELVYRNPDYSFGVNYLDGGSAVIDRTTGRIHLWVTRFANSSGGDADPMGSTGADVQALYFYSTDNGLTWTGPDNRTAAVKKQSGTTAPFDAQNAAWGWWIPGPAPGVQIENGPYKGRLIIPCDHRYSVSKSGTCWSHVMYSDDHGATWTLGGLTESTAGNQGSNEFTIAEYGRDGYLYGQARMLSGNYRGATRSLDGGATWSTVIIQNGSNVSFDGVTTTTALPSISTQGCVVRAGNDLYCSMAADTNIRACLRIFRSTDGGLTWPTSKTLFDANAGYSTLMAIDRGSLLAVYERTNNISVLAFENPKIAWYESLAIARLPVPSWFADPVRSFHWIFNEASSGSISTVGQQILDRGGYGCNARGGAAGAFTDSGFSSTGTGVGAVLCDQCVSTDGAPAALGNALDIGTSSWCLEIVGFKTTNAGTKYVVDNRNNSGAGFTLLLAAINRFQFVLSDGTNSATFTPNAASYSPLSTANTGALWNIRVEYDAAAKTLKMWLNGVPSISSVTGTTTVSTSNVTGSTIASQALTLGSLANGTSGIAMECREIRITKGGLPTSYLDGTQTKQSLASFLGYTPPTMPDDGTTGRVMWLMAGYDGGYQASRDLAWQKDVYPAIAGLGIRSYLEPISGIRFDPPSTSRGWYYDRDDYIGLHYRLSRESNTAYLQLANATAQGMAGAPFNKPNTDGVFSLTCAFKMFSSNVNQILLDTRNNTNANPGISIKTNGSGNGIDVGISRASGGVVISESFSATLNVGTWYFLGVTGDGSKIRVYTGAYGAGRSPPTLGDAAVSSGTMSTFGGTITQGLTIGDRATDGAGANIAIKDWIYNTTTLNATQMQWRANQACAQ